MLQRFVSRRSIILGITLICAAALPAGAVQLTAPELSDVLGADGIVRQPGPLIPDLFMVDPALAATYPNLPGGISDINGNGVDPSDPPYVEGVEIISIGTSSPRPAYFPYCDSCVALKALEFGNTGGVLPPDSAGLIFTDNPDQPSVWWYQVVMVNQGMVDGQGRLTGFDYFEQIQLVPSRQVISNIEGKFQFLDQNGDGVHEVWRVDHAGDTSGGGRGPAPFVFDIDIITEDLNDDGKMDIVSFNDFFAVWDQLGGWSSELEGAQPYLPLVDDPTEPGLRTIVFNDDALMSATVAGGPPPLIAPVSGARPQQMAAIPALSRWGMGVFLTCLALAGWVVIRRCIIAAA